jgi:hypothetical protein
MEQLGLLRSGLARPPQAPLSDRDAVLADSYHLTRTAA